MTLPNSFDPDSPRSRNPLGGRLLRAGDTPASDANVANIITVIRILLTPVFLWILIADGGADGADRWTAGVMFVVLIATDSLDGVLARRNNLITDVGIILDPIADKVLTGGALVALSVLGEVWWWVTIVILVRELGITAYRFAVLRDRVIPASRGGKIKTIVQSVAIALYVFPLSVLVGDWVAYLNAAVMGLALLLTIGTGIDYLARAHGAERKSDG